MRKLMVVLLSGAICLLVVAPLLAETNWGWSTLQEYEEVTGNKIEQFSEAPMLRLKVAAGELPPIEERLGEEPLVDKPFDEVGTYGGVLRLGMMTKTFQAPVTLRTVEYTLNLDRTATKVVPNIAKGWEFSDEGKTFTLYLRRGTRWSDGAPFTADDILFLWEGVILNDEIMPVKPAQWMPGGELMRVEKVDDYTVSYHFSRPYWSVVWHFSGTAFRGAQNDVFLPKHALKKYHIDYNPEADELAKEEGYDHWWQLFNEKRYFHPVLRQPGPDIPIMGPWIVKQTIPEGLVLERNPYYFKIDTAGNQLPYIDTVKATVFGDTEGMILRVVSGQYDYCDFALTKPRDYPVFMEGAEQGEYYVWLIKSLRGGVFGYFFDQNYTKDPVIGELLRDKRFRQALSMAVNREEINEIYALGMAVPRAAAPHPSCSFYKEEWEMAYAEYEPEKTNRILDEIGLEKRDKEEYRLKADGETLHIIITFDSSTDPIMAELIKEYWEEVGVKTSLKPVDAAYLFSLWAAGDFIVSYWDWTNTTEPAIAAGLCARLQGDWWAPKWWLWRSTKGEQGEEPPEELSRMWSLYFDEVPYLSEEERNEAIQEVFDLWAENVWYMGTIGMIPYPSMTNINLKNINTDTYTGASVGFGTFNRLYQAFWKK